MESRMEGQPVVTSDDAKLGHVIEVKDDCVIVETGHVFKARHAIPSSFVHEDGDTLRATVAKEIVTSSPKIEEDSWDCEAVLVHYGLAGPYEVDPDPDGLDSAETAGARSGVEAAPSQRIRTLGEVDKPDAVKPTVRERQANAADPTGTTANLK